MTEEEERAAVLSKRAKGSRRKGGVGEREACRLMEGLTTVKWKRSAIQSRRGGREAADIIPDDEDGSSVIPDEIVALHIEVKRQKQPNLFGALKQAVGDCEGTSRLPMVLARREREEWVVMLRAGDLLRLARALRQPSKKKKPPPSKK